MTKAASYFAKGWQLFKPFKTNFPPKPYTILVSFLVIITTNKAIGRTALATGL